MSDKFHIELEKDGFLHLRGREGFREAICPVCGEPIRWVLDVFSFAGEPHDFRLSHARCVWTDEALGREVWAITFDQEVYGLFTTEEAAERNLAQQIADGGPAWDDCKIELWKVR